MADQLSIINRALTEIAARQPITTLTGAEGVAAAQLYQPAVEFLLRQQAPEFARATITLSVGAGTAPIGWAQQYLYPVDCMEVRQIVPVTYDVFDPQPIRWDVGTATIAAVQTRVIWTNVATARMVYTTNAVTESEWDAMFQEQVVRYLGSMLIMPIGGRLDMSREFLGQAGGIGGASVGKDS